MSRSKGRRAPSRQEQQLLQNLKLKVHQVPLEMAQMILAVPNIQLPACSLVLSAPLIFACRFNRSQAAGPA